MGTTIKRNEVKASALAIKDISKDVKLRVIAASGKLGLTPNDILREDKLAANLDYSQDDFDLLQILLDRYIKGINGEESVTSAEIGNCKTVGDCIDLIKSKVV